jgi:Gelsolin repeat
MFRREEKVENIQLEMQNLMRIMTYWVILLFTIRVNRGKLLPVESDALDRTVLSSDKCYLLDCYSKLYLWMGKTTPSSEKKASITSVEVSFNMISILAC